MNQQTLNEMHTKFQSYIINLHDSIDALEEIVSDILKKNNVLDYSLESLDDLEIVLIKKIENPSVCDFSVLKLKEMVSSYMGEMVRKKLNGKWRLCIDKTDIDYNLPMVTFLDGLPEDFGWSPIQVLFNIEETKKRGVLKKATKSVLE